MKLSARNILGGQVSEVTKGAVNSLVGLKLKGGGVIFASITNASVDALGLKPGTDACAIVKASGIIVGTDLGGAKVSARNVLSGKICKVVDGPVSAEVDIEVAAGVVISAVITEGSAKTLGFKVGDKAFAMFKASSVIMGVK